MLMLKLRGSLYAVACVALFASVAWSSPIVDGSVGGTEYQESVSDTYVYGAADETGMTYYGSGLDIEALYFSTGASARYIGLTVDPIADAQDHSFDPDGSPASYTGQTAFNLSFYVAQPDPEATPSPTPLYYLNLIVSAGNVVEQAVLTEWDATNNWWQKTDLVYGIVFAGGVPTFDPTIPSKFNVQFGQDLEISLADGVGGLFLNDVADAQYFIGQLDDLGGGDDDQIVGHLPEPGTLALLALGAVSLMRRKRRG